MTITTNISTKVKPLLPDIKLLIIQNFICSDRMGTPLPFLEYLTAGLSEVFPEEPEPVAPKPEPITAEDPGSAV